MKGKAITFIRYPGGKQRILEFILDYLPDSKTITGKFIDPFLGGGSVFFAFGPERALLSDLNPDLIELYEGVRKHPDEVWEIYRSFPSDKEGYYKIRDMNVSDKSLAFRAARTLYLNRTCFKGMWRHNAWGRFNVGYGGQSRRWVINKEIIDKVAVMLKGVDLRCSDFEPIIAKARKGDFIFADPPYKPGARELTHAHYKYGKFKYEDHERLAKCLSEASKKGVKWALTTSSHADIVKLFEGNRIIPFPRGTGKMPGILTDEPGEVLILNYGRNNDVGFFRKSCNAEPSTEITGRFFKT